MAHGSIRKFDPAKESDEDFQKCFKFYCSENNIIAEDDTQIAQKNTPMLGQAAFTKLRDLANFCATTDLTLTDIVDVLTAYCHPHTIEIAKCFKSVKCMQEDGERVADFVAT